MIVIIITDNFRTVSEESEKESVHKHTALYNLLQRFLS